MPDLTAILTDHTVAYSWQWVDPDRPYDFTEVRIEGRRQAKDEGAPSKWAVRHEWGDELNRAGEWENAPSPSNRTDEYLARTRWDSPAEALAFIEATLPGWASQGDMPCWAPMRVAREAFFQRQRDALAAARLPNVPSTDAPTPEEP